MLFVFLFVHWHQEEQRDQGKEGLVEKSLKYLNLQTWHYGL